MSNSVSVHIVIPYGVHQSPLKSLRSAYDSFAQMLYYIIGNDHSKGTDHHNE